MAGRGVKGGGRTASPITAFAWEGHQCPSPGRRQCGSWWRESSRIWKQHPGTTSTTVGLKKFSHSLSISGLEIKVDYCEVDFCAGSSQGMPICQRTAALPGRQPPALFSTEVRHDNRWYDNQSPKFHLACSLNLAYMFTEMMEG